MRGKPYIPLGLRWLTTYASCPFRAGMCFAVDVEQLRRVDVRVALCRGELHVAEELLDRAQVSAAFEQVRRKRMPQGVRADPEPSATGRHVTCDQSLDAAASQTRPAKVDEQRLALGSGRRAEGFGGGSGGSGLTAVAKRCAVGEPRPNGILSGAVERHEPFLCALAHHTHHPRAQVHFLQIDADQLAETKTGRVEQLEDCAIAAS